MVRIENIDLLPGEHEFSAVPHKIERENIRFCFCRFRPFEKSIHIGIFTDIVHVQFDGFSRKIFLLEKRITGNIKSTSKIRDTAHFLHDLSAGMEAPTQAHIISRYVGSVPVRPVTQRYGNRKIRILISIYGYRNRNGSRIEIRRSISEFHFAPCLGRRCVTVAAGIILFRSGCSFLYDCRFIRLLLRRAESPDTQQASDGQ